jgi:hypothetical protein
MPPKANKAKAKAASPSAVPADADDMQESVAAELGVVNYKQLRATSENLNKTEEAEGAALRTEVYDKAMADDAVLDAATANALADLALRRFVFMKKLAKAFAKHVKKTAQADDKDRRSALNAHADLQQAAPGAGGQIVGGGQAPPPASPSSDGDKKKAAYQEVIVAAYNRVIGHKVFKDVASLPPNPIQEESAGDCGVQAH